MCLYQAYPSPSLIRKGFITQWKELNDRVVRQFQDWDNPDEALESAKNLLSDCRSLFEYWHSFDWREYPVLEINCDQTQSFIRQLEKTYNL